MSITVPIPETFIESVWLALGLQFGRSFGKKLDQDIQKSEWFKKQNWVIKGTIRRILDFTHHWWIGALIMLYATKPFILNNFNFNINNEFFWFGAGLLLDDLPDIPRRIAESLNVKLISK